MLNGWRHGTLGSPLAFKTHFGWVLAGAVRYHTIHRNVGSCYRSTVSEETFERFWEMEDYNLQQPVLSLEEKNGAFPGELQQRWSGVIHCAPSNEDRRYMYTTRGVEIFSSKTIWITWALTKSWSKSEGVCELSQGLHRPRSRRTSHSKGIRKIQQPDILKTKNAFSTESSPIRPSST